MKWSVLAVAVLLAAWCGQAAGEDSKETWQETLSRQVRLLGHRNWIVIADAAYPWQTAPGVTTIDTGNNQLDVVEGALAILSKAKHVKPTVYVDKELEYVAEDDAPGITQYRESLKNVLGGRALKKELHEEIIKKLDAAGQTFHVLVLKTRHTQPYTSVFLQLECGYWNEASEKRLREALQASASKADMP